MARQLPVIDRNRPADEAPVFERIAIVGLGLIGGSLAMAIRRRWARGLIIAIDSKDVLEAAMRSHTADVAGDDLVMAGDADLIVLAAPVQQNITTLGRLSDYVPGDVFVTDVGGTKASTLAAARSLPPRMRFIGGHPLAGAAAGGFSAARPDLFAGRPWLITPPPDARPDDLDRLEQFIAALDAHPRRIDADAHDRLIGYLSHLPQLTASALMHVVGEHAGADGLALSGRGLRDTTRLASSPPEIWRDIAETNPENIRKALDELIAVLQDLRRDLPEHGALDRIFESAAGWKRHLDDGE
ncbi:MAG TPA: prephenate dehydrogenase/arogenate dehydrogenase family protein [Vicinamibacterales bacterium]|nr:prephenate dehydrogenase/arogenate dehydrogenase family protein [Vicinamibacterales bacterium]